LDETMMIGDVGIFDLINAFQRALRRLPAEEKQGEIHGEVFTVTDRINHLMRVVDPGVSMRFEELFGMAVSRSELVVTFLAILELIRMKQFRVRQEQQFGEIWLDRALEGEVHEEELPEAADLHTTP